MRTMISAEAAKAQMSGAKKAVKKKRKTEIIDAPEVEVVKVQHFKKESAEVKSRLSAGLWRPIMEDSIARVHEEIFPDMTVREGDKIDIELAEMAYILSLTMVVGNEKDLPRRGLKIKEVEFSDTAKLCKECR